MTPRCFLHLFCCASLVLALIPSVSAQDNVTIPKSRLEELERKEAELRRLKGETNSITVARPQPAQTPVHVQTRLPVPTATPPAPTLPPLKPGEIVEAPELAGHFVSHPAAAQQRYVKKQVTVRGEIMRFHKRMLSRDYGITLKTDNAAASVICEIQATEGLDATYIAKNGTELVGQRGHSKTVLVRVGDRVVVQGRCKAFKDNSVTLSGASLRPAP